MSSQTPRLHQDWWARASIIALADNRDSPKAAYICDPIYDDRTSVIVDLATCHCQSTDSSTLISSFYPCKKAALLNYWPV